MSTAAETLSLLRAASVAWTRYADAAPDADAAECAAYDDAVDALTEAVRAALAAVEIDAEYDDPEIEELGGCTYATHDVCRLTIGAWTAPAPIHAWSRVGWLRRAGAGAGEDLIGAGLALWGDAQQRQAHASRRRGWSVCDGDGASSGRASAEVDGDDGLLILGAEGGGSLRASVADILGLDDDAADALGHHVGGIEDMMRDLAERVESALDDGRPHVAEPSSEEIWDQLSEEIGENIRHGHPWGADEPIIAVRDEDGDCQHYQASDDWESAVEAAAARQAVATIRAAIRGR